MSWCCTYLFSFLFNDRATTSCGIFHWISDWLCASCSSRATHWPSRKSDEGVRDLWCIHFHEVLYTLISSVTTCLPVTHPVVCKLFGPEPRIETTARDTCHESWAETIEFWQYLLRQSGRKLSGRIWNARIEPEEPGRRFIHLGPWNALMPVQQHQKYHSRQEHWQHCHFLIFVHQWRPAANNTAGICLLGRPLNSDLLKNVPLAFSTLKPLLLLLPSFLISSLAVFVELLVQFLSQSRNHAA